MAAAAQRPRPPKRQIFVCTTCGEAARGPPASERALPLPHLLLLLFMCHGCGDLRAHAHPCPRLPLRAHVLFPAPRPPCVGLLSSYPPCLLRCRYSHSIAKLSTRPFPDGLNHATMAAPYVVIGTGKKVEVVDSSLAPKAGFEVPGTCALVFLDCVVFALCFALCECE